MSSIVQPPTNNGHPSRKENLVLPYWNLMAFLLGGMWHWGGGLGIDAHLIFKPNQENSTCTWCMKIFTQVLDQMFDVNIALSIGWTSFRASQPSTRTSTQSFSNGAVVAHIRALIYSQTTFSIHKLRLSLWSCIISVWQSYQIWIAPLVPQWTSWMKPFKLAISNSNSFCWFLFHQFHGIISESPVGLRNVSIQHCWNV